jgi:hypothetical protein
MTEGAVSPLEAWANFYVMLGSSAAALTGLQFVVIALGADSKSLGGHREIRAFGTPTIVHFCAVLLISAIVTAPWPRAFYAGVALGICGAAGLGYGLMTLWAAQRVTVYQPVPEDWLWHLVFPLTAYAAILAAGIALGRHPGASLFAIGAAALFLLFLAIHNAWDAVTYMLIDRRHGRQEPDIS